MEQNRYNIHELKAKCPVCKTEITREHPYPEGGYNAAFENVNRHAISMHLLSHMMACGCLNIKEVTPYEKCHKCGEMALWEGMHMHGKDQDVFCQECYDEACYTNDWGD